MFPYRLISGYEALVISYTAINIGNHNGPWMPILARLGLINKHVYCLTVDLNFYYDITFYKGLLHC